MHPAGIIKQILANIFIVHAPDNLALGVHLDDAVAVGATDQRVAVGKTDGTMNTKDPSIKSDKGNGVAENGEKKNEPYIPGRLEFVRQPTFDLVEGQKYIVGTVKNTSNRDVFYEVRVKFMLQDQARVGLGEIQDYKDWIEPGETWSFRALVLDSDAVDWEFIKPILGER